MQWLGSINDSVDMNLSKFWEIVKDNESLECCKPWGCKESDRIQRLNNKKKC